MKTAKGGVGKKGVAPVKKGPAKKKVTKKPVGSAMTKKAESSPKKAPVAGAAKKKPVGVKRQSARMKNTQNSNSEKKSETNEEVTVCKTAEEVTVCEATDDVVVIEAASEKAVCENTDEVVVCETPYSTTVEAKNVSGKTPVKDAAKESIPGKVQTDTASSDPKEPPGGPSQAAMKDDATKIQDKNATSSGSKGTSDVLSKIGSFGIKKEEKKPLVTGEKKVSGNLGALMASFFSRQREMEKASVSGCEEKVPEAPRKVNSPNNEAKGDADQPEKSDGGKPTTNEKRAGKSDDSSVENQEKDRPKPLSEGTPLIDSSKFGDVTSFDKGKNSDAEKDCKSPVKKELSPEKSNVKRPATRKGMNSPRTLAKGEDHQEEKECRKVTSSIGAFLAGLGSRQEQMPESKSSPLLKGKSQILKVEKLPADEGSDKSNVDRFPADENKSVELKVEEFEKVKAKPPKSRGSPRVEDKDQEKNQVESKKIQSLGSLLAGLGSRKEEFMSPVRQTSAGKSEIPKVEKFPADEIESDMSKEDKFPADEKKSDVVKVDEPEKEKAKPPKSRSSPRAENKDLEKDIVETKKIQSLGSLLAGLGSRKEEFKSPDRQTSSVKSEIPEVKQLPGEEHKSFKSKLEEPKMEKKEAPKSTVENKKIQSLGSLLAGLGSRKEEFTSPDTQTASGKNNVPRKNQFPANENRWGGPKLDGPENERGRGPDSKGNSKVENKSFVENKKIQGLGSLLAGLGSRKEEFLSSNRQSMSSDGQSSSDSRGGSRMSESNRRFGDFGFVSDKIQRNKKRSWDSSEDNNNENQFSEKSKRTEEPVVKEENDVIFVRGHVPKPKPTEKELANRNKSLEKNMTFEEEAERRKTHCLGNLLSSLANRPPANQNRPNQPRSRGYSDHQSSRGYSDRQSSRGYSDQPPSRGYSDRSSQRGYSDRPSSRGYSDHPQSRNYSDRQSSRGYPDHFASSRDNNNSYGQGRQWNRDRGETDFRKRRRDDCDDEDDGRDKRWREKEDNTKGTKDKKDKEPFDPKKAAEIVKSEEERLEKEHGPGVFSVGFTESRILAFVCEICNVQLNKATLEVHADGMQHLKKKNLWEKKKRIQKASSEEKVTYAGGRSGWVKVDESEQSNSATPSPAPTSSAGDGSFGFDGSYGQGGYGYNSQMFKQPPPFGSGRMDMRSGDRFDGQYGVAPGNNPALAIPGHINTAIPPPPPPSAEAPQKAKNAKGGATVSLLQRLDACAVKNEKDLDLAASVISALLKSLKEFNHKRGDTKVIEVLTEIDIKFRSLKSKSVLSTIEKPASDGTTSVASGGKPTSSQSGYPYSDSSSAPNYDNLSKDNSSGTWYSQGRGNSSVKSNAAFEAVGSGYSNKSSGSYTTGSSQGISSKYSSQPPPANIPSVTSTGYSQQTAKYTQGTDATSASYYSSGYSAQTDNGMKQMDSKKYLPEKTKDSVGGYYTQPPGVSQPAYQGYPDKTGTANVMEIIRSGNEPPPPPPPEGNSAHNYAAQGYSSYPPMGYYNLSAPPPNYNPPQY